MTRLFPVILLCILLSCSATAFDYYFAGGYVSEESEFTLNILNTADSKEEDVVITLFYDKNDSSSFGVDIDASSQMSIDLSKKVDSAKFGGIVTSRNPLVVDTVRYDSTYSGGFGSLAASSPGFVWYFGEGYSSGMAKSYLFILNPNSREANVGVTLYYDNSEKKTFNVHVPADSYLELDLKEKTMPEKRFGIKVTSTTPVVAATGNFNKRFSTGSGGIGASELSKVWYFADGYTSTDASEFMNLVNPSLGVAHVTVTLYYDDGSKRSFDETVPAQSKKMLMLNNYAEKLSWFSTVVESDVNIVAELTHHDDSYSAGHGGVGSADLATTWNFASGIAGKKTKSHVAIFNPSAEEAAIDLTIYYSDGTVKRYSDKAPSLMRTDIDLGELAIAGRSFGLVVNSSVPIVAQEVIFDPTHSAGYGYSGMAGVLFEDYDISEIDTGDDADTVSDSSEFILLKEETIAPSRMKESVSKGLVGVVRYSYDYNGSDAMTWSLEYSNNGDASKALDAASSGGLFKVLEVSPDSILERDLYHFISSKSEGFFWLTGKELFVFVAEDEDTSRGLAELYISTTPEVKEKSSLTSILLIIIALIMLIVLIRWMFRRSPDEFEEDEDEAVWQEIIPSAKPKEKNPKKKKAAPKKTIKKRLSKKKAEPTKKSEERPEEKKVAPRFTDGVVYEIDEIPDYEDVFRHVNRDNEEIKPR